MDTSFYYEALRLGNAHGPLRRMPISPELPPLRPLCSKTTMMTMFKNPVAASLVGALLLAGGVAIAQRPVGNVSGGRHPNLAAAQRLSEQAWQRIVDAQKANEWDLDGHAQKAKNLLDEVNRELKLAAETANREHKKK